MIMHQSSIAGTTCYYAIVRSTEERDRVRFGFSERKEAQIVTSILNWANLAERLRADGCQLVELGADRGRIGS